VAELPFAERSSLNEPTHGTAGRHVGSGLIGNESGCEIRTTVPEEVF
jgi:hypothetical protein